MSIQPRTTSISAPDDPSWLGSAHGYDATQTVTLDVSAFTAGTHYPNGYFPSGLAIAEITATGKYGPYTTAAADGTETLVGFLATPRQIDGQTAIVGALFNHGTIREARLPIAVDAAGIADVAGRIQFI